MTLLRLVAWPTMATNVVAMVVADLSELPAIFTLALAGATLSGYGILILREEHAHASARR